MPKTESTEAVPFLWGAATSGHQIEGGNDGSDWWAWEAAGNCEGGVRSGAATDHRHRFREDLERAQGMGLNSYRFSIEWSRIEPEEGRFDETAIAWYADLLTECEKRGLLPMVTLHHFASPQWFAEKGGFAWDGAPARFAAFTRKIARTLGPRIPLWCTFNEPMVLIAGGYLAKIMPPAKFAPELAGPACRHILKAHLIAYGILRNEIRKREGPWKDYPLQVGIAHNMLDFRADRAWHLVEQLLARTFRRFYNRAWLDAVTGRKQHFGVRKLVPYAEPVTEALGRVTVDFIGINYYTKAYVQWKPRDASPERPAELPLGLAFARRKEPASDLDWAIYPEGLARMIRQVRRYGLPIHITENGIADRDDKRRPAYLVDHLKVIAREIALGADIRGYYHWSLLDNFEWVKGFGPRFGLLHVDYDTFARTERPSAHLMKEIVDAHDLADSPRPTESILDAVMEEWKEDLPCGALDP